MIILQQHCDALSRTLSEIWQHNPTSVTRDDETLEFNNAAEWLDLAASISKVDVLTGRFDDSLVYCGTAMEYEDTRSDLLCRLATAVTIFSFAWGAFETVSKIVDPPSVPASLRLNGANSIVDRTAYYIRSCPAISAYSLVLDEWNQLIRSNPDYSSLLFATRPS